MRQASTTRTWLQLKRWKDRRYIKMDIFDTSKIDPQTPTEVLLLHKYRKLVEEFRYEFNKLPKTEVSPAPNTVDVTLPEMKHHWREGIAMVNMNRVYSDGFELELQYRGKETGDWAMAQFIPLRDLERMSDNARLNALNDLYRKGMRRIAEHLGVILE